MLRGVFFFLVSLTVAGRQLPSVVLSNTKAEYEVAGRLYYFEDTKDTLTISQVVVTPFIPLSSSIPPSFGFSESAYWFRIDLDNQSTQKNWLLEVAYAPLDYIEIYTEKGSGWQQRLSGDYLPVSSREIDHRNFVFPLEVDSGLHRVYIKVKTTSSVYLPVNLWQPSVFYKAQLNQQFAHGIFYGILLIMVFYNLFLYFSVRDVNTLYYVFTLLAGMNVIAFFQGYGFYFLYPEYPRLNASVTVFSGPLFVITSGLLARSFLNLGYFNFWLDRTLLATSIVTVLAVFDITVISEPFSFKSLHLLMVINSILILVSAVYCFYRKYRPARYFLLAWISLLLAITFYSLRNLGFIQPNWFTESALYIGGVMQTLLISLALGDRINILTRQNQLARENELKKEQMMKDHLERTVITRTEEIRQKNEQLEEINVVKDRLFSVISHDLKGPLNSLRGTLSLLELNTTLSSNEMKKITATISDQLHDTSALLDHLLQWGRTQLQGVNFNPQHTRLNGAIDETLSLLRHEFNNKGITISVELTDHDHVFADRVMLSTVIRNLLSNALKFTPKEGEVSISTRLYDDMAIVTISDSGVGISAPYRDHLFTLAGVTTLGTREEKGTGIGLVLCREFVERNGGAIWVESDEGKGSRFSFSVPTKENRRKEI